DLIGGQFLLRLCSFLCNFALLRFTDPSLLGFFNVRINLLYNTIGFLSREPVRKLCLSSDIPLAEVHNYSFISSFIALFTSTFCCTLWFFFWTSFVELSICNTSYLLILIVFSSSVCIELLAEPIIIEQLKSGRTRQYVFNGAILLLLQKVLTFAMLLFKINPFISFSLSQLIASLVYFYLFLHNNKINILKMYKNGFLQIFDLKKLNEERFKLLKVYLFHSILKQFLTDGANFIMAFSGSFPLKIQAVYDAVDRLASLFVRLILQPFEESASIYFSINLKRIEEKEENNLKNKLPKNVLETFLIFTKLILIFGLIIFPYGFAYSKLAAFLYGGSLFEENKAHHLLSLYSIYLPIIAINGLSECFVFAQLNSEKFFYLEMTILSQFIHVLIGILMLLFIGIIFIKNDFEEFRKINLKEKNI
ncbi:RFT1-like protein, partial [Meloidogyne graminicola]